jgi:diaminohydroxyphosphoribosylaminopyrimidine deaminase/5-amino-6-(5-phosphoribosylamino)uracil reductase
MEAETDAHWMSHALELAARGRCGASPNPMVGAVILDADGELVGAGYHAAYGGPHAEVEALRQAGQRAIGGTMYVTLEPCAHTGKTPPCVDAIIAAGLRRVKVATRDPNPHAAGGIERLQAAGIEVDVGVGSDPARRLNQRFILWVEQGRPWVTLKSAVSLDGKIATSSGQSQWITGSEARRRSLELREEHDAILVGVGTVLADDPQLTRRLDINPVDHWQRIILDSRLRTPLDARVVREDPQLTTIAHTKQAPTAAREALAAGGVTLLELPEGDGGKVHIPALLEHLAASRVAALLVEGGATVTGSFVDAGLVDEAIFFIAPLLIGGPAPSAVAGSGFAELGEALHLVFSNVELVGDDLEVHAVRPEESHVHRPD